MITIVHMASISRRTFAVTALSYSQILGANDRVRMGYIGLGNRGDQVHDAFLEHGDDVTAAVCDLRDDYMDFAIRKSRANPQKYKDYRKLLENNDIDAVVIATPDHWHALMFVDACRAGKDVYVEKPLCHTPEEGMKLVEAEKHTKSVVQVGMQRRSYDLYQKGRDLVAAHKLGAVRMVRSWWLNNYLGGGVATKLDGPLDWEQWQGPAERRPFDANRFRQWRFYSEYAGGILADQGAHVFDGIHMLMGAGFPSAVNASAGKPHKPGVNQPESVVAIAEYPEDFIAAFSINYAAMQYRTRNDQLNQLDGDAARMDIGREELKIFAKGAEDTPAITDKSERGFGYATDLHVQNFLECVRTRNTPAAPMRIAFQAALVVQMANMSLKQGRRLRWNAAAGKVEA
jgi:predicted dehydrogenase